MPMRKRSVSSLESLRQYQSSESIHQDFENPWRRLRTGSNPAKQQEVSQQESSKIESSRRACLDMGLSSKDLMPLTPEVLIEEHGRISPCTTPVPDCAKPPRKPSRSKPEKMFGKLRGSIEKLGKGSEKKSGEPQRTADHEKEPSQEPPTPSQLAGAYNWQKAVTVAIAGLPWKTLAKMSVKMMIALEMRELWQAVMVNLPRKWRKHMLRLPIVSTIQSVLPKKYWAVLKDLSLPAVKTLKLVVPHPKGMRWYRAYKALKGWRTMWLGNILGTMNRVRRLRRLSIQKSLLGIGILVAMHEAIDFLHSKFEMMLSLEEQVVADKLTAQLQKRALFTSRTPETLAMLRDTGIAAMERIDEAKCLTEAQKFKVLLWSTVNAQMVSKVERSGLFTILKNGGGGLEMHKSNSTGAPGILHKLVGWAMPKR
uniref:Uncharacterized protein n=1 Tax=Hangzhou sesamia inferens carmotetravirus 1 TaxID=2905593 RepID=A0A8K1XB89_9LUTE|nr:MAG: hypothetical protein FSICV1_gp1a [Hangzhou sesamia inferens carmotetravirus 1]